MFESGGQAYEYSFNVQYGDPDLLCYCEQGAGPLPELTEDELQQLEQRAEVWYMSMM